MNGSEALGPLEAAMLLSLLEKRGLLLVDAATFVVSAALLASLPSLVPVSPLRGGLGPPSSATPGRGWATSGQFQ